MMRALPWTAAAVALVLVLAVTGRHGLGVSMDSVAYARAAERLREQGAVEVAVTPWDSDARYAPLVHFPPALPVVLATLGAAFGTSPYEAARWLNAGCIFGTVLVALLPLAESAFAMLVVTALLAGPAFLPMHAWLWSEPLFLLALAIGVRLAARALEVESPGRIVLLGLVTGIATLTRYTGLSLGIGFALVLAAWRSGRVTRTRRLLLYGAAYVAVVLSGTRIAAEGSSPRVVDFYTRDVWARVVVPLGRTMVRSFVPQTLHLPWFVSLPLVAAGAAIAVLVVRRRIGAGVGPTLPITAVLLVTHLGFLVTARLFADPGISFDERMLSGALVLTALGLGDVARAAYRSGVPLAPSLVATGLLLANLAASAPELRTSATEGLGYTTDAWRSSPTLAWLRDDAAPARTIFSNAPDAICAALPVTAKMTPAIYESSRLDEFRARVERAAPAALVLFDDPHAGWLLGRRELLAAFAGRPVRTFADGVVLTWDAPSS